ncbi:hypothetical protein [Spirillospora sp. NPDC047279]|uniref:hypothetical protein n=1 Tax=Spirillospora sp. NPDC047279 TaxID=3155478 RepID=UPI0034096B0C
MSVHGVWVVGAISDADSRDLIARFSDVVPQHLQPAVSDPDDYAESLSWWENGGDTEVFFEEVPGRTWRQPTDAADRFADLAHLAHPETSRTEELWDVLLNLLDGTGPDHLFTSAARKASPAAALYYALGAVTTRPLPGRFGTFLLTNGDLTTYASAIDQALDLSGARRDQVLQRISTWMREMGDAPEFDAASLVDGPLHVMRQAVASGQGLAAFTRWY